MSNPPQTPADLFALLAQAVAPDARSAPGAKPKRRRPGRPPKFGGERRAVLLQLYVTQLRWLDSYADWLAKGHPDHRRLSRVEILRACLMALGKYLSEKQPDLDRDRGAINSEHDLTQAVYAALLSCSTAAPRKGGGS